MTADALAADVTAERPRNRRAGIAAALFVALSFAGLVLLLSTTTGTGADDAAKRSLLEADDSAATLWLASGLRVVAMLLLIGVGLQLTALIRARTELPGALRVLVIVAPLWLIAAVVLGQLALLDAADAFTAGGPQTDDRAEDLLAEGGLQRASAVIGVFSGVLFAAALTWLSLAMLRAGLLTTTLGYWGAGAGLASLLVPVAGQALVLGWLGSVALLLLGWWPGGIGPAWSSGQAEPWQGEPGRRPRGDTA